MKTDELIGLLGADAAATPLRPRASLWRRLIALGAIAATLLMATTLRLRPDLASAAHDPRFWFKFVATLSVAIPACLAAYDLARPDAHPRRRLLWLLLTPALLVAAAIVEMTVVPESLWWSRAMGRYAPWCVACVPLLSLAPMACIFAGLARGAPRRPRLAGLVGGLAAGAIGAAAYAGHCPDDSPLFVMIWYTIGVALSATIGAALGPRLLRW